MKIIRNDRPDPIGAEVRRPAGAQPRLASLAIRFAVVVAVALAILGLFLNR